MMAAGATRRLTALGAIATAALGLAGCGSGSSSTLSATVTVSTPRPSPAPTVAQREPAHPTPPPPLFPSLLPSALASAPTSFVPAVRWQGRTAALIERTPSGVAMLSFDQRSLELKLHSGTVDAGTVGWRYGPAVGGAELRALVAAFNGGFRLSTGAGGFMAYGHVAVPLRDGVGSIVTYADGTTDIGSWRQEVPAGGSRVVSVRQNLNLLIDHGSAAPTVDCVSCWGATLGGVSDPARAGLGITADGRLVWAGGEHLTASQLSDALLSARVVRAVELDINPEWVAGYLYGHRGGHGPLAPVPVVPGQSGIPGFYLVPWSRDFFTVVAR